MEGSEWGGERVGRGASEWGACGAWVHKGLARTKKDKPSNYNFRVPDHPYMAPIKPYYIDTLLLYGPVCPNLTLNLREIKSKCWGTHRLPHAALRSHGT